MKKTVLTTLFIIGLIIKSYAGGYKTYYHLSIDVFEQSFNFYYKAVDDTVRFLNAKGKEKYEKATVNVAFYDIEKDSVFNLFPNAFNEKIVGFFYESEYLDSVNEMDFVVYDNYREKIEIKNNHNIKERVVSEMVFILTYSFESDECTLWTCHKTGTGLKKFSVFKSVDDLKVDVYNKNLLTLNKGKREIRISKKGY